MGEIYILQLLVKQIVKIDIIFSFYHFIIKIYKYVQVLHK